MKRYQLIWGDGTNQLVRANSRGHAEVLAGKGASLRCEELDDIAPLLLWMNGVATPHVRSLYQELCCIPDIADGLTIKEVRLEAKRLLCI